MTPAVNEDLDKPIDELPNDSVDTEASEMGDIDDEQEYNQEGLHCFFRNDTLFVAGSSEELPSVFVMSAKDGGSFVYKMLGRADQLSEGEHPASDMYGDIWTSARVNPYHIPVDSMKDSVTIDTKGFVMPHPGYITSHFGMRRYRFHYGTDIKIQIGDSIRAAWDGQVRIVGYDHRGYGHYVVIRHDNGLETVYGHLSQPLFDENERIYAGEVLGLGGNTGRSTGPHLHWEIRYLGNAINTELLVDYEKKQMKDPSETYLITKAGSYYHLAKKAQNGTKTTYTGAQYHKVRQGDTLSGIAKKYRTSVSALMKLNKLKNPDRLSLGQQIRVR